MKQFLNFDQLITPKMIHLLYFIVNILLILGTLLAILWQQASIWNMLWVLLALLGVRMFFEMVMISFKNNEYLRDIALNIKQINQSTPPVNPPNDTTTSG